MTWRRILGPIAGVAVSIAFLALAMYRVDLNAIGRALRTADYRLVGLSALFTLSSYVFRTLRWGRFLNPQKRIGLSRLFPVLVSGFALNNFLPGRPGELARAIALGQREGLPKSTGLATVIIERVADGLALIALLAFISLGFDLPGWGRDAEGVSIVIFMLALLILLFLLWREHLATRLLYKVIRFLPTQVGQRLARMLGSFILGLHSLRSPRDVLVIGLLSFAVWLCEAVHYFLILTAFGMLNPESTRGLAALFTMVMVNLSISIPAAPGGVGPFEAAGVLSLGAFGLARERSLPALLVAHAVQYVLISGLGILFIAHAGASLAGRAKTAPPEQIADRMS
jgi:glycosyltransferase 2 family protein